MTPDEQVEFLNRHISALREHYECVHIFVSKVNSETGMTATVNDGDGNWYARYGQIRCWLEQQDALNRTETTARG